MEDVNLIQKKKEINEATFFVTQSTLLSEKKGLILQTIMNFLVKNIRKMKDIIYIENIYKNNYLFKMLLFLSVIFIISNSLVEENSEL